MKSSTYQQKKKQRPAFLQKSRQQIAAFIIAVNAEGPIKEDV